MNGEISKSGVLFIERNGVMKQAYCCFSDEATCSDYCVALREPHTGHNLMEKDPKPFTAIELCSNVGTLIFDKLDDQREKAGIMDYVTD